MTSEIPSLAEFGWNAFFSTQVQPEELLTLRPVRLMAVHRDRIHIAGPRFEASTQPFVADADDPLSTATVGDWLLIDAATGRAQKLLERRSLFKRRAAGTDRRVQLIAANVDTLFIVSSCNQDFNAARLERYLAVAREAEVTPVVVLTKADLADAPADYVRAAAKLLPGLTVECVDAREPQSVSSLAMWCGRGQTVALVGSSGVGKSTLVNTLTGEGAIATRGIREDDAKGRHTTTGRMLHRLPTGGWLLDTPGMRELQLTDIQSGLADVFADIVSAAAACRFADCRHEGEPGCAVAAAVEQGEIDADRIKRWRKLAAEEAHNAESISERRARDRAFGKMARRVMREKQVRRDG